MSSTSSQESAVSPSDSKEPGCEPSRSVRSASSAVQSSESIGQKSRATPMSEASPGPSLPQMALPLMSSPADSHAKTSALPDPVLEFQERVAVYGRNTPDLLASYDPASSSWRTSQICLLARLSDQADGSAEFSETWPRSGLMRNGTAYQLPPLVPNTAGSVSGSWHTPVARDFKGYTMRDGESICNQLRAIFGGPGVPHPRFVEQLMGFPIGWTELRRAATRSSRKSQKSSGDPS